MKHTGKLPDIPKTPGPEASRPLTPNLNSFHTLRQRALGSRSPLGAPASFINQQGGVEALFQGAAKGAAKRAKDVMERGEKLGINQAVRDAMGEIRRNMQNLNDTRHTARPGFNNTGDGSAAEAATTAAATALVAMEKRSQQLAGMLEESVASLRAISAAGLEDKAKSLETIEVAAAKVDFVKVHLEDPTLEVPTEVGEAEAGEAEAEVKADEVPAGKGTADGQASPPVLDAPVGETALPSQAKSPEIKSPEVKSPEIKASVARTIPVKKGSSSSQATPPLSAAVTSSEAADAPKQRPSAVPARSSIAQSSFSWMLEPDESTSGGGGGSASGTGNKTASAAASARSPTAATHRKRPSNGVSRERNAFLFGDEGTEAAGPLGKRDDLFSMEQLKR